MKKSGLLIVGSLMAATVFCVGVKHKKATGISPELRDAPNSASVSLEQLDNVRGEVAGHKAAVKTKLPVPGQPEPQEKTSSLASQITEFTCYASKYQTDITHAFQDGYVTMAVDAKKALVDFTFYYVNTVAHETTISYQATYKIGTQNSGSGAVAGYYALSRKKMTGYGEGLDTLYLEPALLLPKSQNAGVVGKYTFTGHGYSYDWNICYYKK
jgi:hypothetical protein